MIEKGFEQEQVYSKILRAGRRTYFFDVRATKADDYYLTITESIKFTEDDGSFRFKKHKIAVYKEDFDGFKENLEEIMNYVIEHRGTEVISERHQKDYQPPQRGEAKSSSFTDLDFDDI